jgi:hypothetical protein
MARLVRQGDYLFLIDTLSCGSATADVTALAVGPVRPTDTADRGQTQNPISGFDCLNTPFGKGHLIALFLGGPDVQENYAPQYEQWQQGGTWKAMELRIKGMTGGRVRVYMLVQIIYGRTGNQYQVEVDDFCQNRHYFRSWTDFRIPTRFQVWTFKSDTAGAAPIIAALDGTDNARALATLQNLPTNATLLTQAGDLDHSTLPPEDYLQWRKIFIRGVGSRLAAAAVTQYKTDVQRAEQAALATPGVRRLSRADKGAIEARVRTALGFSDHRLARGPWKLAHAAAIATEVTRLIGTRSDRYDFRPGDIATLASPGGATLVTNDLTGT